MVSVNFFYAYLFISYLISSIPFGLIITKLITKKDVRSQGSGNIGATNVLRTGSKTAAIMTLIFDLMKGFLPVLFINNLTNNIDYTLLVGFICIIGHIFPLWLKFKGGKGVATTIGVVLAVNYLWFFYLIFSWIVTYKLKKISSLSAMVSIFTGNIFLIIYGSTNEVVYFSIIITLIIFLTHKENIKRIIKGDEK